MTERKLYLIALACFAQPSVSRTESGNYHWVPADKSLGYCHSALRDYEPPLRNLFQAVNEVIDYPV